MPAILVASLLLGGEPAETNVAPAPADRAALIEGKLPDDPAREIVKAKCLICHTGDYVTQQRLTAAQWLKTVEKMRKFGAPLNDDEVKQVSEYLGRHWTPDLPERRAQPGPPPKGSLPSR